jgi:hypothetical protein
VKCDDPKKEELRFYYSIFLEGDNKEEELEEGEEGEIYFCTLSVILKVSKFLACSVICNLLLGIVPKQSLVLFLGYAADSSDATTGGLRAVVILRWRKWWFSWRKSSQSPTKVRGIPKYCHLYVVCGYWDSDNIILKSIHMIFVCIL